MRIDGVALPSILRPPWPFSRLLVLFAILLSLPLFFLVIWDGFRIAREEHDELNDQAVEIANRISSNLDQTVMGYIMVLQTLAKSFSFDPNNLGDAYKRTKSAVEALGLFARLHDSEGRQLFDTQTPLGSVFPSIESHLPHFGQQASVSDLITGGHGERPVIGISVPVTNNTEPVYSLSIFIDAASFKQLLDRQELPPKWTAAIIDRIGIIIARSRQNEKFAGTRLPPGRDTISYRAPDTRLIDLEGRKVVLVRRRSNLTGWSIAVFVRSSIADVEVNEAVLRYAMAAAAMAALGIACCFSMWRLIVGPLSQVKRAAEALGKGDVIPLPQSVVEEAREAISALARSAEERRIAERNSRQATEHFIAAEEGAGGLVYDWDVSTDHVWLSEGLSRMLGWTANEVPSTSAGWISLFHPGDSERLQNPTLCDDTDPQGRYGMEVRVRHCDGYYLWVWDRGRVFRDDHGVVIRRVGSIIDISSRKSLERQQLLLLKELSHRSKNLLGVIQSIAARTLAHSHSLGEASDALSERLESLARTYDTLTQHPNYYAPISKILEDEVSAFADRVKIDGPALLLNPNAAQTIALIVHELATNAAKYGSLSVTDGAVFVRWSTEISDGVENFNFYWEEKGGPPVDAPKHFGFGSVLTEEMATYQFDGRVRREFAVGGLNYELTAPLSKLIKKPA